MRGYTDFLTERKKQNKKYYIWFSSFIKFGLNWERGQGGREGRKGRRERGGGGGGNLIECSLLIDRGSTYQVVTLTSKGGLGRHSWGGALWPLAVYYSVVAHGSLVWLNTVTVIHLYINHVHSELNQSNFIALAELYIN